MGDGTGNQFPILRVFPKVTLKHTARCGGKGLVTNNKRGSFHFYVPKLSQLSGANVTTKDVPMVLII